MHLDILFWKILLPTSGVLSAQGEPATREGACPYDRLAPTQLYGVGWLCLVRAEMRTIEFERVDCSTMFLFPWSFERPPISLLYTVDPGLMGAPTQRSFAID